MILMFQRFLNWTETVLQLFQNIILFAICGIHTSVIGKEGQINTWCFGGIICLYTSILYNVGDIKEPWGSSIWISLGVGILPLTGTVNFHSDRNELISLIKFVKDFNLCNFYKKKCAMYQRIFRYPRILPL
jgi:hypothetical protein